jgi:hypothetical protein
MAFIGLPNEKPPLSPRRALQDSVVRRIFTGPILGMRERPHGLAAQPSTEKTRRVESAGFVQAVPNSVAPVAGAGKIAVNFHVRVYGVALTDGA